MHYLSTVLKKYRNDRVGKKIPCLEKDGEIFELYLVAMELFF